MQQEINQIHSEVFISYCDQDRDRTLQSIKSLEAASVRIWIDRDRLETAGKAVSDVEAAIKNSKVVLFMCSDVSLRSRLSVAILVDARSQSVYDALRNSFQASFGNFKSPHWFAHMNL